jgi:hypothetical protein
MSRIDKLKEQHPELNITVIDMLARVDPTDSYKYTEFLIKELKQSIKDDGIIDIALNLGIELIGNDNVVTLNEFEQHVKANRIQNKDISQYKSFEQIKEQVRIAEEIVRQKELEKQVEKLFEDDEYLVLIPLTKESNQTYGSKTKWCTTMDYNGYWEKYSENYKFIFVLNKQTGEKIAISKGIYANEGVKVWDQRDNDISIFDTGLPSNIYEVVSKSLSVTETNQEIYNRKFPKKNEYVSSYDDFMDFSFGNNRNDEEEEEIIPIGNGRSETYIDLLRRYMSNMGLSSEEYSWLRQRYGRNL